MKFSNMYTFFRFYRGKVCLSTYKVKASGQKIGLESNLASPTSIFKQVLEGLLNPSFNKSYMRLLSKKQKNIIYIFVASFCHKTGNTSTGHKGPLGSASVWWGGYYIMHGKRKLRWRTQADNVISCL